MAFFFLYRWDLDMFQLTAITNNSIINIFTHLTWRKYIFLWDIYKNHCVIWHSSKSIPPSFSYISLLQSLETTHYVSQNPCSWSFRYALSSDSYKHSGEICKVQKSQKVTSCLFCLFSTDTLFRSFFSLCFHFINEGKW